jgi:hypothetical protein
VSAAVGWLGSLLRFCCCAMHVGAALNMLASVHCCSPSCDAYRSWAAAAWSAVDLKCVRTTHDEAWEDGG